MGITNYVEKLFKRVLPSPFTIAVLLTLCTIVLALLFTENKGNGNHFLNILSYWESGIWNGDLIVFAYQMMLILVLGHVLVLSKPMSRLISQLTALVTNSRNAVIVVSFTTLLVSFFNWGLGLVYGAILARKVGEHAQNNNIKINYPLVGAAGYSGLMIWHGGISGSAPLKVAESGHLSNLMVDISDSISIAQLPNAVSTDNTIFSWWNLLLFGIILLLIPLLLKEIAKKTERTIINLSKYQYNYANKNEIDGAEKLDYSMFLAVVFGLLILFTFSYQYWSMLLDFAITPNMLNFFMLGLAIVLHGSFRSFSNAVEEAIKSTSGILIQFPLYFGIMGIMKSTGMVNQISDFFVSIATQSTLPIFTFFSAGLVNIFVPSGGGQWAVQGPIVIESALKLGVPLPKAIMALAYGDQITNMLQPFWALPLLGITQLKAKEILPYTLLMMTLGILVFIIGLLLI